MLFNRKSSEPRSSSRQEPALVDPGVDVRRNCSASNVTFSPFGGLLSPNGTTSPETALYLREYPEGDRVAVTQTGVPVHYTDIGETLDSRWSWSALEPDLELHASWFHNGRLRQGMKARACVAWFLLTDKSLRVALSADYRGQGPWVHVDEQERMLEAKGRDQVFAAAFPLCDITEIATARNYVRFTGATSGLVLYGKMKLKQADGSLDKVRPHVFAEALMRATLSLMASSDDAATRAAAARLSGEDYATAFTGLRGATYQLRPSRAS